MQKDQFDDRLSGGYTSLTYNSADHYRQSDGRYNHIDSHYDQIDGHYNQVDHETPPIKSPWRLVICIILGVVVILAGAAFASPQFRHQIAISVVRQPTLYTQLYFPNPGGLSGQLQVDKKNTFRFTIENDENRAYSYTYVVTLDDSRSHQVISKTSLTVGNGDSATPSVIIIPKDRKSRYLVTITLEGLNQSIHFYGQTS
jgi:hypothetical protein